MSLPSLNSVTSLADLDPYGAADVSLGPKDHQPASCDPDTPFTRALRVYDPPRDIPPLPFIASAASDPPPLIDISGPSPPRAHPVPAAHPASAFSAVHRPHPLQFSIFDDSFDAGEPESGETTPSEPAPFANPSPPPTVRRLLPTPSVRESEETENHPVASAQARPAQRRWSAISRLQEERRKASTLSPIRDSSPIKEGDSSMVLSPVHLGAGDLSLIVDEAGSFLYQQHDATFDSFALSQNDAADDSAQKDEPSDASETSDGMSVLLRGLGESTIERAHFPTSAWVPSLPSILPPSLTDSTRTITPSSPRLFAPRPSLDAEPSFFAADEPARADMSLLNASTASFADYRDSPIKPRVVSQQAERWPEPELDDGRTPRPPARTGRVSDASISSGSATEEGPSGTSFDFTRWKPAELGTGILNQSPPTAALRAESTRTLQLGLQSPIQPTRADVPAVMPNSPVSDLACSIRTVLSLDSPFRHHVPSPFSPVAAPPCRPVEPVAVAEGDLLGLGDLAPSPPRRIASPSPSVLLPAAKTSPEPPTPAARPAKETGAERLKRRTEELRAQKKATAPAMTSETAKAKSAAPFSSASSSGSATPRGRMSLRPPSAAAAPATTAGRISRPRPSALPALAGKASTPPLEAAQPEPPKTPGERKDSTAARLERLRLERKQRELARSGAAPSAPAPTEKTATGLRRMSSVVAHAKPPVRAPATADGAPRTSLATRKSAADLRGIASGGAASSKPSATGLTRSRSLVAPASRPLSAGVPVAAAVRPAASPRKSAMPHASLVPPAAGGLKRASTAPKLEFASMAAPRSRVPLGLAQPATAGSGIVKPRTSRIGLGRPATRG
ncbi:hypothetical protein JCM3770_007355 [Rhodotorula araucariae]